MSTTNVAVDLRQGFKSMGLGQRYHGRDLESTGPRGVEIKAWLKATGKSEVRTGSGRSFYGEPTLSRDLFMVTARACYLFGIKTKIISLSALVQEASGDTIDLTLAEAKAIFVTSFYTRNYGSSPFTHFQKLATEDFLLEHLDNSGSVFTLSTGPLAESKEWWSEALVSRISSQNLEVEVA